MGHTSTHNEINQIYPNAVHGLDFSVCKSTAIFRTAGCDYDSDIIMH